MHHNLVLISFVTLTVTGCSNCTGDVYKSARDTIFPWQSGGYSELMTSSNRYVIRYHSMGCKAIDLAELRAAELTIRNKKRFYRKLSHGYVFTTNVNTVPVYSPREVEDIAKHNKMVASQKLSRNGKPSGNKYAEAECDTPHAIGTREVSTNTGWYEMNIEMASSACDDTVDAQLIVEQMKRLHGITLPDA